MSIINKYREYLFSGEWHIHTNFTDGKNSILEYAEKAVELRVPLVAFTEHVRKKLNYDFSQFLNEIDLARKEFPSLIILSGCEAKVLPDRSLDCDDAILEKVDYKTFGFHFFCENITEYFLALRNILANYDMDAWVHPGLFFKRNGNFLIPYTELDNIFKLMKATNTSLEMNLKYKLPNKDWIGRYKKETNNGHVVFGGDVHDTGDFYYLWKLKREMIQVQKYLLEGE